MSGQPPTRGSDPVRLWDVQTGRDMRTLSEHQDWVSSVSFSPDGKTIASGSENKTIKLWIWDFEKLMQQGCDWISGYLMTRPNEREMCAGYLKFRE